MSSKGSVHAEKRALRFSPDFGMDAKLSGQENTMVRVPLTKVEKISGLLCQTWEENRGFAWR